MQSKITPIQATFKWIVLAVLILLFVPSSLVSASNHTTSLRLFVNGQEDNVTLINGEPVQLTWEIQGNLLNCQVSDGSTVLLNIGDVNSPDTPVYGQYPAAGDPVYIPAADSTTDYEIRCNSFSAGVTAVVEPVITLTVDGGNVQTLNFDGENDVTVRWDAENANRCDLVEYELVDSDPGNIRTFTVVDATVNSRYVSPWDTPTGGYVHFHGYPYPNITESTRFYITCHNDALGTSATASTLLTMLSPAAPSAINTEIFRRNTTAGTINVSDSTITVATLDADGYASVDFTVSSQNADRCYYHAEPISGDGIPQTADDYPTSFRENVMGWEAWSGSLSRNLTVEFAASSRLFYRCTRPAITVGGVPYPAAESITFVQVLLDVDPMAVDRTVLPEVQVSLETVPPGVTAVTADGITGLGRQGFIINSSGDPDYCHARNYRVSDGGDDDEIAGWYSPDWAPLPANNVDLYREARNFNQSYTFTVYCQRDFDVEMFGLGTPEGDRAYAEASITLTLLPPTTPPPGPEAYLYVEPVFYTAPQILSLAIVNNGFSQATHDGFEMIEINPSSPNNSITFPFSSPHGAGLYDIGLDLCDENDGVSNFVIKRSDGSTIATYSTDQHREESDSCRNSTLERVLVARGVDLAMGEQLTIECAVSTGTGERCRLNQVMFAKDFTQITLDRDPSTGLATANLAWRSRYATECFDAFATDLNSTYRYSNVTDIGHNLSVLISTTTTFEITCRQAGTNATDPADVVVKLPLVTSIADGSSVSAGQCRDDGSIYGVPDVVIDAPDGYIPGINGYCTPAVDLAALAPSLTWSDPDGINGTWGTVEILQGIENLGPGDLPSNSDISYKGIIDFPQYPALSPLETGVGTYSGAINGPPGYNESGTLTEVVSGVPFGTHTVFSRVNLDGSPNYPEASTNLSNNINSTPVTVPIPEPPMSIRVDPPFIRENENTMVIPWIHVTYPIDCAVRGPGFVQAFTMPVAGGGPFTANYPSAPLTATSEFVLTCTEPMTGASFSTSTVVEMIPNYEEI